jgi:hypothetical protein
MNGQTKCTTNRMHELLVPMIDVRLFPRIATGCLTSKRIEVWLEEGYKIEEEEEQKVSYEDIILNKCCVEPTNQVVSAKHLTSFHICQPNT